MTAPARWVPEHLQHLSVDRRGLPVPYINRWGPETAQVRYDRVVHQPGLFHVDDRAAAPDFTRQAPQRQRQCVIGGLCQVCARPLPWPDRRLVIATSTVHLLSSPGPLQGATAVHEPWLCPPCTELATTRCPELIRRRRDEALTVLDDLSEDSTEVTVSTGTVDGYPWAGHQVALWAGINLRDTARARHLLGAAA